MFTVEIRINSTLIAHVYGRNIGPAPAGNTLYTFEYYEVETKKVQTGTVSHDPDDGLIALVKNILGNICR